MRRNDLGARRELPAVRHQTRAERWSETLGVHLGGRFDVEHDDGCPRPYPEVRWLATMPPTDAGVLRELAELECAICHRKRRLVWYQSPDISPTDVEDGRPTESAGRGVWERIEEAYRRLAVGRPGISQKTGFPYRRRHPHEPSRPELAADLGVTPKTVTRWCDRAGRGTHWPPAGL